MTSLASESGLARKGERPAEMISRPETTTHMPDLAHQRIRIPVPTTLDKVIVTS